MSTCELCGEPMPAGEEMFKFHGYSGPCPKPPKADKDFLEFLDQMKRDLASIPDPIGGGVTAMARKLVEDHIERHGPIPESEKLIDEIATVMGLAQIYAVDQTRAQNSSPHDEQVP